ncbi:MAG: thioesterase family protein [Candidatus Dormiibacterota bacterium]|jgi:acyl-CoA thioester hydrolase
MPADPLSFTARWSVRQYEVDRQGHVNNAVYLNYAEELASRHSESIGFGQAWALAQGGAWVIRRHEITYHSPARFGDELELTVQVELVKGARGQRRTTILQLPQAELVAEIFTEWVWVRASDGRPAPVPRELVDLAAEATAATLLRRRASGS